MKMSAVEWLVIVAIICILCALLTPVFSAIFFPPPV